MLSRPPASTARSISWIQAAYGSEWHRITSAADGLYHDGIRVPSILPPTIAPGATLELRARNSFSNNRLGFRGVEDE
jgi:hypothetical protein